MNTSEKVSEKTSGKSLEAIRQNPKITTEELSQMLGVAHQPTQHKELVEVVFNDENGQLLEIIEVEDRKDT